MLPCITAFSSHERRAKDDPRHVDAVLRAAGEVTPPMNGFVDSVRCASTISRCRLFTGISVGSHTVPPEWCSHGLE